MKNKTLKNKKVIEGVHVEKTNMNISLDDMLVDHVNNPFGTTSEAEFQEALDSMNLQDMEVLGTKVELRAIHDRRLMKDRLMKAFKVKMSKLAHSATAMNDFKDKNKPLSKRNSTLAEQILSEGK